jgi:hypothetical protein
MAIVHIADGENVTELGVLVGVAGAHGAGADAADPRAVVGSVIGKRAARPGEGGDKSTGDGGGAEGGGTEELTA